MGVLGITPFLQKTCPEVIKRLPDRLKSLRGATIVIDGTLVTQRLHFAPTPHPHRHVLGWHRILTELKECDVRAICVFDGKERNAAKARETERRRETRRVNAARGSIEADRLHRLEKLMHLLPQYCSLRTPDRQRINEALEKVSSADNQLSGLTPGPTTPSTPTTPTPAQISVASTTLRSYSPGRHPYLFAHGGMGVDELQEVMASMSISQTTTRSDPSQLVPDVAEPPPAEPAVLTETTDEETGCDPADDSLISVPIVYWSGAVQPPSPPWYPDHPLPVTVTTDPIFPKSVELFESELFALYHEYKQSVAQLTSMPSVEDVIISDGFGAAGAVDAADAGVEYAMSKQQLQMTSEEGRIWESMVASSPEAPLPPLDIESTLSALATKSGAISESYQQTYEESKEILRAMGVPCIESTGPFEAEALASSLVLHGHADYVASEDTDAPIVVVSGKEIRTTLQLGRESYIDFALLLGTDFSQRIKNVGPSRALKFIREHGSIERVIEQESKYPPRVPVPDYLEQVSVARLVFQTLPPVPDPEFLQQTEGDPNAVSEIIQKHNLHRILFNSWDNGAALAGNYFADDPSAW
ncbi:PIN domain-like protein [Melanogaster broomeanus]|nr:PIN domain-like protein [Melanogaster broomeanus]